MRAVVASIAVHLALLLLLAPTRAPRGEPPRVASREPPPVTEPFAEVTLVDVGPTGGGASAPARTAAHRAAAAPRGDAWQQVTVRMEPAGETGGGTGTGTGNGNGNGTGTGLGIGPVSDDIPPPPPPPVAKVSKARPAQLVYPRRDREVEDEQDLFIARITVDRDGDVVGARMVKTRPGVRGEQASNAIWTFRYLPALDDDGRAIASTFEQPFQIAH